MNSASFGRVLDALQWYTRASQDPSDLTEYAAAEELEHSLQAFILEVQDDG